LNVPVEASIHIRRMEGMSDSHLIMGSDSKPYVVKFLDNPQHKLVPANEWLGTHLALFLNLPVPRASQINVSEQFVLQNPTLTRGKGSSLRLHTAGIQFGSAFVGGLFPGRSYEYILPTQVPLISNKQDFLGALVFDRWVCNSDSRQAVFVSDTRSKSLQAYFIDHGNCFGMHAWLLREPEMRALYRRQAVYSDVTGLTSFEPWLARLRTLDVGLLWQGFASMPAEWYREGPFHPEKLIDALDKRRQVMPDLIMSMQRAWPEVFPFWKVSRGSYSPACSASSKISARHGGRP